MTGKFIVIEGPNNSGKTTIANKLRECLLASGVPAGNLVSIREPGGTVFGEELRRTLKTTPGVYPFATALAMNAARAQLAKEKITPALNAGKIIICDRYTPSTEIYQLTLNKISEKKVKIIRQLHLCLPTPSHLVFALPPLNTVLERAAAKAKNGETDVFEQQNRAEREYKAYQRLIKTVANIKPIVLKETNPDIQNLIFKLGM